jgi:cation transport regulator ChaB
MPRSKDKLVQHIKDQYMKKGYSEERAESIAWATVTKQEKEKEDGSGSTD